MVPTDKSERRRPGSSALSRMVYHAIRWVVRMFYPKITVEGTAHLPPQGCVIVGNHAKMNGPIISELYLPGTPKIWCAAQMMELKAVPAYAYNDFWRRKPLYIRWAYRLASYLIAPLSVCVFNNAHTIPVYHDQRLLVTFRRTMDALAQGTNVVIFPECPEQYTNIVNRFQERFADIAKPYYTHTGNCLTFVPMYVAPNLKKAVLGQPITYNPDCPMAQERRRICRYLMEEITSMARQLPPHTVVPYNNIPKKHYPTNCPNQEDSHENTCR